MNIVRKIFASALVLATIVTVSGMSMKNANAAAANGDLIKMNGLSTVYYYTGGKRYVFPNQSTYMSWYPNFSGVKVISQSELEGYPLGANVTVRPGTYLVKITTNPNVYAVEPGGKLRSIVSEANASSLWGANWAKKVIDVADSFFTNYTITTPLTAGMYPAGSLVKTASSADVYYFDGTNYRKFASESAFYGNNFNFGFVQTAPTGMTFTPAGLDITGPETTLTDVSSGASGSITGTGLSVALASDTPASMTVPTGATGVKMAKFNFTAANDGDVILSGLSVKRLGVGDPAEISGLYLYDGATRITNSRTVSSSDNTANFVNINYTIPKGTTKSLTVVAALRVGTADVGSHAISIQTASAVTASGATVTGSFPMTGNSMSFSSTPVGTFDVESNASGYTRKVGETGVEVANFTVWNSNVEDATFSGITLYNSQRDVVNNLQLYQGSTLIATATKSGNTYFTFTLATPITILKGNSMFFTVKADISGRKGDEATIDVRYASDVNITGNTYGFGLAPTGTLGSGTATYIEDQIVGAVVTLQSNNTTVEAGQLTVTQNGPSTANIGINTTDVTLLNFTMTAQSALDISKATVVIAGNGNLAAGDLSNLKLQINGTTVSSTSNVNVGDNVFNDTWSIPAGTTVTGRVAIDITNSALGNETISAALKDLKSTAWTIKTSDTGDTVTDIVPSGDITGNTMNVTASALSLNGASSPAAGSSYVKGFLGAPVAGFAFTSGSSNDVTVNSIKVTAYYDSTGGGVHAFGGNSKNQLSGANNVMVALSLWDTSVTPNVQVGTTKSLTVGGSDITATFDTLNWLIPKNTTKSLVAKANISTATFTTDTAIALAIVAQGDVNAQYGSGNNLSITYVTGNATPTIYQLITTGGTLTQTLASDTPVAGLVVAASTGIAYTKVKFSATNENYVIDKLTFLNSANDANFSNVSVTYPTDCLATPTMATTGGTLVASVVNFAGLNFKVCKDTNAYITINGDLNPTLGGATNGHSSHLDFDYDSTYNNAVGQDSGAVIATIGSADAIGKVQTVYQTVPTVVLSAGSPSGTLIPAVNELVAKYDILATGTKDITMGGAAGDSLVVTFGGTSIQNKAVYITDGTNTLCTGSVPNGGTTFTCDFQTGATGSLDITPGSTKTLWIYADTSALTAQGNTIQAYLDDSNANNFVWSIDTNSGHYATGVITFRNKIYAGSLVKP
jgi:hypothetical protein